MTLRTTAPTWWLNVFPQVILVRNQERLLYARNHNVGMKMSRARYACHLDSDTLLTSNAFAALVGFMDEHPEVAACGPKLLNGDGSVQHCIRGFTGAGTFAVTSLELAQNVSQEPRDEPLLQH